MKCELTHLADPEGAATVGWVSSPRFTVRALPLAAAVLSTAIVLAGCDSSSTPAAAPTPSTSTTASPSPSPSPSTTKTANAPSQKAANTFLNYLYAHNIPRGVNAADQIKLGVTFVCASYKFHETTPQILQVAKTNGLHPRSKVKTLMTASVKYFCPQYATQSGLPVNDWAARIIRARSSG